MIPQIPEAAYVVDTNALYWYLIGDKKLAAVAQTVFNSAEQGQSHLYVSVVSLAELFWILQKRPFTQTFEQLYTTMKSKPYFEFVSLEPDEILDLSLDSAVPEMHDRIIVGLARRLSAPLITSDGPIAAANVVKVIW